MVGGVGAGSMGEGGLEGSLTLGDRSALIVVTSELTIGETSGVTYDRSELLLGERAVGMIYETITGVLLRGVFPRIILGVRVVARMGGSRGISSMDTLMA